MDKINIDISASSVAGVAGLIGIRSDKYYYVGKLDQSRIEEVEEAWGKDYVPLKDAYELVVQHRPQQNGSIEMALLPLPIGPFRGPTRITVRVDGFLDLSTCEDMVEIDRAMVGSSVLVLPNMAGRVRPGNA